MAATMSTTISLKSVVLALETLTDDSWGHVNRVTGEVWVVGREEWQMVDADDVPDNLPSWQYELVAKANGIYTSADWLRLPRKFDIHEWDIMDRFAASLEAESSRTLRGCLRGKGAFHRFHSRIRQLGIEAAWFRFRNDALENIARTCLEDHGLPYK